MRCKTDERAFELTKQDVAAVTQFASTDKTRPHISCVRFEPTHGTIIVTDGHTLATAKNCGKYEDEPFHVPAKVLAETSKLLGKNESMQVWRDGDSIRISTPRGDRRIAVEDVLYPDWRQVLPAETEDESRFREEVGFNARYLARLEAAQKASEANGGVHRTPVDHFSPLVVTYKGMESTWTCLVMPMRV